MTTIPLTRQILAVILAVQTFQAHVRLDGQARRALAELQPPDEADPAFRATPEQPFPGRDWYGEGERYFESLPLEGTGLVRNRYCYDAVTTFVVLSEHQRCRSPELPIRYSFTY